MRPIIAAMMTAMTPRKCITVSGTMTAISSKPTFVTVTVRRAWPKKHNGCRPPGHAKVYQPGFVLGPDIHWSPLPHDLLALLHPAPRGYQYVEVDKNVYLIGEASKKIIDAVTLLSALD
jgi:hypothetical protein